MEGVEEKSLPKDLLEAMRSYGTTSALPASQRSLFETPTLPPSHFMLHKAAAGKAYEFASSVKEKLDETAESQARS